MKHIANGKDGKENNRRLFSELGVISDALIWYVNYDDKLWIRFAYWMQE